MLPFATLGPPSRQIHRDVDGRQKCEIARDADDRDDEGHADRTVKLRQQPAKANRDDEESDRPYRIFDGVAKYFLVSTACHEKHSAIRINGTITHAAFKVVSAPVIVPS